MSPVDQSALNRIFRPHTGGTQTVFPGNVTSPLSIRTTRHVGFAAESAKKTVRRSIKIGCHFQSLL